MLIVLIVLTSSNRVPIEYDSRCAMKEKIDILSKQAKENISKDAATKAVSKEFVGKLSSRTVARGLWTSPTSSTTLETTPTRALNAKKGERIGCH